MNALFLAGSHEEGLNVAHEIAGAFATEKFLGNPLFHLRVGQCLYELLDQDERELSGPGTMHDELARALIGGGIEIFDGEDPKYLAAITKVSKPPDGVASWEATRGTGGTSVEMLNGAAGFLAETLGSKYGNKPPYGERA